MKHSVIILATILFAATSCKVGSISTTAGQENESYLEFIGTAENYPEGVDVNIDGKTTFKAKVHNGKNSATPVADRLKGENYAISPGTHTITVTHNGTVIYKKQIFVSTQETKKITLQ
jgi:hypothetical protein